MGCIYSLVILRGYGETVLPTTGQPVHLPAASQWIRHVCKGYEWNVGQTVYMSFDITEMNYRILVQYYKLF
jgi:hypothetical protein